MSNTSTEETNTLYSAEELFYALNDAPTIADSFAFQDKATQRRHEQVAKLLRWPSEFYSGLSKKDVIHLQEWKETIAKHLDGDCGPLTDAEQACWQRNLEALSSLLDVALSREFVKCLDGRSLQAIARRRTPMARGGMEWDELGAAERTQWEVAALITAMPAENPEYVWAPIDTAPRDGTCVLVMLPDSGVPQPATYDETEGWVHQWDDSKLRGLNAPTHWMPIKPGPTTSTL